MNPEKSNSNQDHKSSSEWDDLKNEVPFAAENLEQAWEDYGEGKIDEQLAEQRAAVDEHNADQVAIAEEEAAQKKSAQFNDAINYWTSEEGQKAWEETSATPEAPVAHEHNSVYQEIARDALQNWNGLSVEEADKKVAESSFEDLEGQVYATGSINSAVNGIAIGLEKRGIAPIDTEELLHQVLHGTKDSAAFNELQNRLEQIDDKEAFTLDILSNIHDDWVKDNSKKFFDEKRANRRYQFMPLELIGAKEASADLLFLNPILKAGNMELDQARLEEAYKARQADFLRGHAANFPSGLKQYIKLSAKRYPALSGLEDIQKSLSGDESVTEAIAEQLQGKVDLGPEPTAEEEYTEREVKEKAEALAKLPEDIAAGEEILPEALHSNWKDFAKAMAEDLYGRRMTQETLKVLRVLQNKDFDGAKKLLDEGGHSGNSYGLINRAIVEFSEFGPDFYYYLHQDEEIDDKTKEYLDKITERNQKIKEDEASRHRQADAGNRRGLFNRIFRR